jgi:hypothetical protein
LRADLSFSEKLPLLLKGAYTIFFLLLVPVYGQAYGGWHFLWFSDLALFLVLGALWRESRLLAGMAALTSLLPGTARIAAFVLRLFGGPEFAAIAYMFDPNKPLPLRLLSLFHLFLPPLLLWLLGRLGYDHRAFPAQTLLAWTVLLSLFFFSEPERNINFVFGFGGVLIGGDPLGHLLFLLIGIPLLLYLPLHLVFKRIFPPSDDV